MYTIPSFRLLDIPLWKNFISGEEPIPHGERVVSSVQCVVILDTKTEVGVFSPEFYRLKQIRNQFFGSHFWMIWGHYLWGWFAVSEIVYISQSKKMWTGGLGARSELLVLESGWFVIFKVDFKLSSWRQISWHCGSMNIKLLLIVRRWEHVLDPYPSGNEAH